MKKTSGIIAAGHPQTAKAGKIALELGGNAFDAAIAAAFASCVVESSLTSLGGSGFCLTHTQAGENYLWDFFSPTPQQKKPLEQVDFYPVTVNFGGACQEFHIGLGAVAVPGNIAGFVEVHRALGRLPLDLVIAPALNYAREGFILTQFNDFCLHLLEPILLAYPAGREIYAPQGKILKAGEVCVMKDLANTLEILAKDGYDPFYKGDIAEHIVKNISSKSYLDFADFFHYQVLQHQPLQVCYKDHKILTNPPPSSGGILIGFALKLLEKYSINKEKFLGENHLKIFLKIMEITNQARQNNYDNYIHTEGISETFLGGENIHNYVNKLGSTTPKFLTN
jgi:gamma-glutamyltranspeptidase/glutathione hydrolase